jgi:hypothetical protein
VINRSILHEHGVEEKTEEVVEEAPYKEEGFNYEQFEQ